MAKKSAGLLMFRRSPDGQVQVLLVHPGGPFWAKKDLGAWSIPKGEYDDSEDGLEAAKREFVEETGFGFGAVSSSRIVEAGKREDGLGLGVRVRERSRRNCQQRIRNGVATQVRSQGLIP